MAWATRCCASFPRRCSAPCVTPTCSPAGGGEEFLLLINDTSPDLAIIGVDRARELLAASPLLPHMPDLKVTFSAGLTGYDDVEELNTCIDRADQALYRAKSEGRDRTVIADPPPPQVGATGTQRLAAAH